MTFSEPGIAKKKRKFLGAEGEKGGGGGGGGGSRGMPPPPGKILKVETNLSNLRHCGGKFEEI